MGTKRVDRRPYRVTATVLADGTILADGNIPSAKLPSVHRWPWKAVKLPEGDVSKRLTSSIG